MLVDATGGQITGKDGEAIHATFEEAAAKGLAGMKFSAQTTPKTLIAPRALPAPVTPPRSAKHTGCQPACGEPGPRGRGSNC